MDGGTPPRTLRLGQRFLLAVACQLWLWVNLFSQDSEFEAITVSLVQLAAVVLIALRLRHMKGLKDRWIRVGILVVVLLVAALDLTIAGRELAGLSVWFSTAKLVPVAAVLALAGVIYCFFKPPTRMTLLLYTVSFVAGMRALALILSGQGNSEAEPFGTVTIIEAIVSMIYPIVFVFKGRFSPVAPTEGVVENKR
jgi:hypothetical protein